MTGSFVAAKLNAPYFLHKDAEVAEACIRYALSERVNIGVNAFLLLMPMAHPEKAEDWERRYGHYIARAKALLGEAASDHVGWNDYWMSRWLILGDDYCLEELYTQTQRSTIWAPPGQSPRADSKSVGEYAVWMTDSMSMQCPEFAKRWSAYLREKDPVMLQAAPWAFGDNAA